MKKFRHYFILLVLACSAAFKPGGAFAQDQAIHFNGTNEYTSFAAPKGLPAGAAPRTLAFWMRSDLRVGAKDNHESVVELGQQGQNGSAFGIFTQISGGKTWLCFWGHNADKLNLAALPDDQWHHVAITYQEPRISCYLDGVFQSAYEIVTAVGGQRLNTVTGTCYLGAFPQRGWYFQGAIDNLSIWSTIRSTEQILGDIAGFPRLTGNEPGLIAYFDCNEGKGTSFKDVKASISGTLVSASQWTKPIASNPDVLSEGIWFVIQNKRDVDSDYGIPAKAMALMAEKTTLKMAAVPLTGDYDAFLWRTVALGNGKYKLVNKKLGMGSALDCGQAAPSIAANTNVTGQSWVLSNADLARYGENAYTFSNDFITPSKAIANNGGILSVAPKDITQTNQVWLLQPMGLVAGYHIPSSASPQYPWMKILSLDKGQTIYATGSVSDWAILNAHNIYNNMMYAFKDPTTAPKADAKKTFYLFGRHDFLPCRYPNIWNDCKTVNDWRGYSGDETVITEEMMGRQGVFMRGPKDDAYREFEQVVHEFGHTLNYQFFASQNIDKNPLANQDGEWFPWRVQYWFNSAHSAGANQNRAALSSPDRNYLAALFNVDNTWLPPRLLRSFAPIKPTFLVSGTLLLPNQPIYSPGVGDYKLVLQADGNLIVAKSSDNGFRWGSFNNLQAPMAGVKSVLYLDGELLFTNLSNTASLGGLIDRIQKNQAIPEVLGRKRLHANGTGSYRLQASDNPDATGNYLRVIDLADNWNTVWSSGR